MHPGSHYEHLAKLFDYPRHDYARWVLACYNLLEEEYPEAAAGIGRFARALPTASEELTPEALDEIQEIFTRTFDVQAVTTLGVGYVMFGDDYKRGEMLVNLSREMDATKVDYSDELPDHLPNVLRLMGRWEDRELAREFVEEILHPALARMVSEFDAGRSDQRDQLYQKHYRTLIASSEKRRAMFREPLLAVTDVIRKDFNLSEWQPPEEKSDFLHAVRRELEIESDDTVTPGKGAIK